ncbi:MAG TPA: hypothetical protein VIG88_10320 [Lysobacter sp.]
MNGANGNPLIPESLAADGIQGADAATWDRSPDEPTRLPRAVRIRASWHIDAARTLLLDHADATDRPDPRAVEAADWLDAATVALASPLPRNSAGGDQ